MSFEFLGGTMRKVDMVTTQFSAFYLGKVAGKSPDMFTSYLGNML